ncbi:putative monooxygenase [Streptomyces ambofaciens ATCC 23877]|uniref:Putative monooxygenase n=1 Tax=Streptomyces ambofaciens (strain ATCC 23877 / 3486 / DSM 40053 / JCM 4204 / NBRC 12836 / NRRL B-2516) TaxID=278992 RepID=A0ACA3_STRA7|nr:LLM class flavin-dependent oxidoreductase [Streptomyces ambofaciens]AKZ60241.1 putative monooxygenase [Streptomyces ambofaciens ATCC 23877]CAJ88107.1 putative monooxygenase [Streptomyces ambofaciens ATCC 23877]
MPDIPLGILDLVPISSGSTAADALHHSIDLARHAERLGYARYWVAEHHLNPGVAGTSPAVVLALTAAATTTIRLGSGAVQLGHRTALSTVEEFGLIDALHPGRLDLGLGRSGGRPPGESATVPGATPATAGRAPNGLLIPPRFSFAHLLGSPRVALQRKLLLLPNAEAQDYAEQIDDILALLAGTYRSADGVEAHAVPGEGADVDVWILGSSGGQSAEVAGARGLRFAANYHVSPATVLEAVDGYRSRFKPSAFLDRPYVSVSADVVVAEDDATARELATGYGLWVRSIRTAEGAIEYPTPHQARAHAWSDEDHELVRDRVETRFVGSPGRVADQLEQLQGATGADELLITTITHGHADRVRSYELLAEEWRRRGHAPGAPGRESAAPGPARSAAAEAHAR